MRLPWRRRARKDRLVVACGADSFVYLQAEGGRILRCGMEVRGDGDSAAFARRVRALGLSAPDVVAVLPLADSQLLKIEAPAVPPEELKAAARWRIKDLVDTHLDDLTLDVMHVGDGRPKAQGQLFVVVANSRRVRELGEWSHAARLDLAVVDICEMAQRNLQSALAAQRGQRGQASAALMLHGAQCLLTICANGELFYARRLEWRPEWIAAAHAPVGAHPVDLIASGFSDLDIVDYSDAGSDGLETHDDAPPLVIELQRSLDLWERSWPDLPLKQLVVHANGQTAALIGLLEPVLPMAVVALDVGVLFQGLDSAAGSQAVALAATPLLGALLRDESRQL
jgi:MSHA biogenesis protein MshI